MKAILITILMALSGFVFGQNKTDNYAIYSNYLKLYQQEQRRKFNYVVRVSTDYGTKRNGESDIAETLEGFRGYLKGEKYMEGSFIRCSFFRDSLKVDTLWLPLLDQLSKKMKKGYIVANKFSSDLQVSMLTYNQYFEYFEKDDYRDIEDGWVSFHEDYPGNSLLINLSEVVHDEKRAVFYISHQCGGLCGSGYLVLYYKDAGGWRFVGTLPIWYA